MTAFELIPGEDQDNPAHRKNAPPRTGLVPVGYLAREFRCTPQAIDKWVEAGCPVAERTTHANGVTQRWYELEKVRLWASANRPRAAARQGGGGHGGQRAGSGRKQQTRRRREMLANGGGGGEGMDAAPLLRQMERGTEQSGSGGGGGGESGGESLLTQETRRLKAAQARKHELDVLERERTLVKMSEVEEAIGQAARNVRVRLETMAARLTGQILTAIRLGPEHGPVLQDLVQTACDEVLAEMVEDPLGTGDITRVAA